MSKLAYAFTLSALALAGVAGMVYGSVALIFPLIMPFLFFFLFICSAAEAYAVLQSASGIERLQEPKRMGVIYNAWLFKTNVEAWARYAAKLCLLGSVFLGTMMGAIFLLSMHETGIVAYVSWLTGLFLTGIIAVDIATAEHWAEKAEAAAKYEEQLHGLQQSAR